MTVWSLAVSARYLSREECDAIAKRALSFSTAEEVRVVINSTSIANTRFAVNQISTGGDSFDAVVTVISKFGKRSGSSSTNQLDDDGLRAAVQMSERVSKLSPEDPEALPELGAQTYKPGINWSDVTASQDPATRATAVKRIADPAKSASLVSTGFMEAITNAQAIANNKGLFAYNRSTASVLTTTVRTPDGTGSGWAGATHHDWSKIDPAVLGARPRRRRRRR